MTTRTQTQAFSQLKPFLICNAFVAVLLISFFAPLTSNLWKGLDVAFFRALNQPLKSSEPLRIFWALANHNLADWLEDACILAFYAIAIVKAPKSERLRRVSEFIFCIFLIILTILLVNRFMCRDILHLRRASPTLVLLDSVYLSDFLSWIHVKINSSKSFPGDHATTALMFALSYAYLVKGRLGFIAVCYAIFLCLPRITVGAHWLTDVVVGSGSIVLFFFSLTFLTPLAGYSIAKLEKALNWFSQRKKKADS